MNTYNENKDPISDCESESKHRDYKPGHFYDGNETEKAGYKLGGEGSMGLMYDQGATRCSEIPEIWNLGQPQDATVNYIPEGKQGSAAHLELKPNNT